MMQVLMSPAWHRQPIVFVLDEAPDQIVQWTQGIELEFPYGAFCEPRRFWKRRAIAFMV